MYRVSVTWSRDLTYVQKYYLSGMYVNMYLNGFVMSDDGFSLKPKYVVRNANYMNLVVVFGLYFLFY